MQLTLSIRKDNGIPSHDNGPKSFDEFPIIIGRSSSCHFVLADQSRYISSNHAVVSEDQGVLYLEDTSANGVYINASSVPIGRGHSTKLNDGDTIAIGDYSLEARIHEHSVDTDDPFAFVKESEPEQKQHDPFEGSDLDWTPPSQKSNDFDVDENTWDELSSSPKIEDSSQIAKQNNNDNHDDWADAWTSLSHSKEKPTPAIEPVLAETVDEKITAETEIADIFAIPETNDLSATPDRPALSATPEIPLDSVAPDIPEASASTGNEPWFDFPSTESPKPKIKEQARHTRHTSSEDETKPNTVAVQQPSPSPRPKPPIVRKKSPRPISRASSAQPNSNPGSEQALHAFFKAAQLQQKDFADQSPEALMTQTGKLLNLAIDGMMVLLQSRAEIKNAIRSDVTQLNRVDNNPLKFSYDARDALNKLLSEDSRGGYLHADIAMQQSIEDLKVHQVALLEGMKAAVKALLMDFDPEKLESSLEKKHPIAANIPITRDAKLWQLYQEHYSDIKEDAVNSFGDIFGIEFRKAYENRIKDMKNN